MVQMSLMKHLGMKSFQSLRDRKILREDCWESTGSGVRCGEKDGRGWSQRLSVYGNWVNLGR